MAHGNRCLLVHGHFYQPPRENPWTGHIDPQYSAAPWENWNRRIADECYLPMARSRVYTADGKITDLYNNYAHTSFNFGPTLLSWLAEVHPAFPRHLADAATLDRTFALAQVYNHMMLPLADARDRHTQILWGLREFRSRFGFHPEGLWLSECGIDPETTRALIDHKIRYVILSPHQASRARPFGASDFRDVSMGAIDTRRAYRLFDTDGAGRTHFDRHLDVIFYTPGLNLKVSFDHILSRPDDLARELERCYGDDFTDGQLVSIVTDGEIYGHHEKRGEEALSRLYRDIAPGLGLKVVSGGEFIRDNPPTWEVKLWEGEDRLGSSWSCEHGMGRWFRNCGCRPPTPPGWTQEWRTPLRAAFDAVRDRVRAVARKELGDLVLDADDARNSYIAVVLDPSPASRKAFLERHARRRLTAPEQGRLWSVLEALRNAMLMYTSCGWFFDEISGLEPVQNMRYAYRACELAQPYCGDGGGESLAALLERGLAEAKSNIPHWGDGGKVFRDLVLPSRHDERELAAAMAVCLAADLPADGLSWELLEKTETTLHEGENGIRLAYGGFVCRDARLDRFIRTSWVARLDDFENTGVGLHDFESVQGDAYRGAPGSPFRAGAGFAWLRGPGTRLKTMRGDELLETLAGISVPHTRLPEAVRGMLYRAFSGAEETALLADAAELGARAVPFLARARRHGARVPDVIVKSVTGAFERRMEEAVLRAVREMRFDAEAAESVKCCRSEAWSLGLDPTLDGCWRALAATGQELLHWWSGGVDAAWYDALRVRPLPDGGEWIAPGCPAAHGLRYASASALADALGRGLAVLYAQVDEEEYLGTGVVARLPLTELLEFMTSLGLDPRGATGMGMAYWDFLDLPLAKMARKDPRNIVAGPVGEKIRRAGALLGFDSATVGQRTGAAIRSAERISVRLRTREEG